jgi:Raf kinase inhibitor-like YbhB/YbcL family protein
MKLSCPDFLHQQMMPKKFSCLGKGVSPALVIEDIPKETKSLVLIVDDPDAPKATFVHWVVYNLAPLKKIEEGSAAGGTLGLNSLKEKEFVPACPPSGKHRYFFKIYALKEKLSFAHPPTKEQLEKAMKDLLLDSCELIGLFQKNES